MDPPQTCSQIPCSKLFLFTCRLYGTQPLNQLKTAKNTFLEPDGWACPKSTVSKSSACSAPSSGGTASPKIHQAWGSHQLVQGLCKGAILVVKTNTCLFLIFIMIRMIYIYIYTYINPSGHGNEQKPYGLPICTRKMSGLPAGFLLQPLLTTSEQIKRFQLLSSSQNHKTSKGFCL